MIAQVAAAVVEPLSGWSVVLWTLLGVAACIGCAELLGWLVDRAAWRRRCERERAAVPRFRVIDGGKRHDWRELARRAPTQRVRAIGARRST